MYASHRTRGRYGRPDEEQHEQHHHPLPQTLEHHPHAPKHHPLLTKTSLPIAAPLSTKEELEIERHSIKPGGRMYLEKRAETYKDTAQGERTRGWAVMEPRQHDRHMLWDKCGQRCFLSPPVVEVAKSGKRSLKYPFPICRRPVADKYSCDVDPHALVAAKQRAAQYGYADIQQLADTLLDRLNMHAEHLTKKSHHHR